jgi:ketosteroid isomerase-like protein
MNAGVALCSICTWLCVCLLGCGNRAPDSFTAKDLETIRRSGVAYARNANAHPRNNKGSAALYAEDAIVFPPNQPPVEGRTAIEAFLSNHPPFSNYSLDTEEIEGEGDLAYERGIASMTMEQPDGSAAPWRIRYLLIWRRQADKSWKVHREMFNPDMGAPALPRVPVQK